VSVVMLLRITVLVMTLLMVMVTPVGDATTHTTVLQLCSMRGDLLVFHADTLITSRLGKRLNVIVGYERLNKMGHINDG
jgi:hypothetical protein